MDACRSATQYTKKAGIWISRGNMARIRDGRGMLLRVQHGAVWLTQTGSTDDVYLDAGESFRIDRDGLTLVSPCGRAPLALIRLEGSIAVTRVLAQRMATRFWSFWAGVYRIASRPSTGWI
jgi:hypothetical protein